MVTLEEVKVYLKVEHANEDALIEQLLETSQQLCEDILRQSIYSEVLKTAILYGLPIFMNTEKTQIIRS